MNETQYEIDARPSDAINLAVRTGAPVYVAGEVMDDAGKTVPDDLVGDIQPFELPDWVLNRLAEMKKTQDK